MSIGLLFQVSELGGDFLQHLGREIGERRRIAALEQFEPPLSRAAAQIHDRACRGIAREKWFQVIPGDAVVKIPEGIVIDGIV